MHTSIHNLNWLPLHGSKYLNKIPTNTFALFIEDYQICILKQIMCSTYMYYSYCLYTHVYIHHKDIHRDRITGLVDTVASFLTVLSKSSWFTCYKQRLYTFASVSLIICGIISKISRHFHIS